MPFIKNPYNLLLEAAGSDLEANTEGVLTEQSILSRMNSIEEVSESFVHSAESVPVFRNGDDLLVEMTGIASFMKDAKIYAVEEALDAVAAANNLPAKSVGLLVESDSYVQAMLEKACKGGKKSKNKALEKINVAGKIADKLKDKGYTVKKKSTKECGDCKDECGDTVQPKSNTVKESACEDKFINTGVIPTKANSMEEDLEGCKKQKLGAFDFNMK